MYNELLLSCSFQLFLSVAFDSLIMMYLCVYLTWTLLSFLDMQIYVLHQIWEILGHSSNILSIPFSLLLRLQLHIVDMLDIILEVSEALLIFFNLFSSCSSNNLFFLNYNIHSILFCICFRCTV